MSFRAKIFTAYTKPDAPDPSDRVELVREGFAFWAFVWTVLWLVYHRLWLAAALPGCAECRK